MTPGRLWILRGLLIAGVLALIAGQTALFAWLVLYGLPEHLFQQYETPVADGKLALCVKGIMAIGPALAAAWLLGGRLLWARLDRRLPAAPVTEAAPGGRLRLVRKIAAAFFWVLVATLLAGAVSAPFVIDRQNEKFRVKLHAEWAKYFEGQEVHYTEIPLPKVLPGREMVIGDLAATVPAEMRWKDQALEGCGLRIRGGAAGVLDLSFPPSRQDDTYLMELYYRIDSPMKFFEALYKFDRTSLDAPRSRLGLAATGIMLAERGLFLVGSGHRVRTFATADGLTVFAIEWRRRDRELDKFTLHVTEGHGAQSKVYLLSLKPLSKGEPGSTAALAEDAWIERALSIAASLRRRKPGDVDEKPPPAPIKRAPPRPTPPPAPTGA